MALPACDNAQVAEAWGLRLALGLLVECRGAGRLATVVGDNLAVIRYGASQGHLRRPHMQGLLEAPLARAALGAWAIAWFAVRRCFNAAADSVATEAVLEALRLAASGSTSPVVSFRDRLEPVGE